MSRRVDATLGELAQYVNGRAFKPHEWGERGLPIVRIANLTNPRAPCDYFDGLLDEGHRIATGDIVVSWSATLDAFLWKRGEAALNQHIFKVLPNKSIDRDYLFLVLKAAMRGLSERGHGATMQHVTRPEFENFGVQIHPDRDYQLHVATRLKAELAEVDIARQAVQAQANDIALLRRRVLAEVFAAVEDAPRKQLGEHAPTTSGSTPPRGVKAYWGPAEVPWVKTGEVAFAPITRTEEAVSRRALAECSLRLLPPGTVLVAMYGQGKTRGQSATLEMAATTNQACFAILPNETWEPSFLFHWLMASYQDLRELSEGRGGNQANLNGALLNALEVPAPNRTQQAAIARRAQAGLRDIEVLAAANQAQRDELERLPQRLLGLAFGEA